MGRELDRAIRAARHAPKPLVTGARADRIQALRKAHASGRGLTVKLTRPDGQQEFIYGETPMTEDYYI